MKIMRDMNILKLYDYEKKKKKKKSLTLLKL